MLWSLWPSAFGLGCPWRPAIRQSSLHLPKPSGLPFPILLEVPACPGQSTGLQEPGPGSGPQVTPAHSISSQGVSSVHKDAWSEAAAVASHLSYFCYPHPLHPTSGLRGNEDLISQELQGPFLFFAALSTMTCVQCELGLLTVQAPCWVTTGVRRCAHAHEGQPPGTV